MDASDAARGRGDRPAAYALFDTALGRCAIGWRGERILAFALPADADAATVAQIKRRCPDAEPSPLPAFVEEAISAVQKLLSGQEADLSAIPLDLDNVPEFERRVYERLRSVGPGETVTYGELAAQLGARGAARAVGAAMGRNPVPVIIPCHRVLAGGGRSGGFSAPGGLSTKFQLLEIERAGRGEGMLFEHLPLAVRK